MNPINEQKNDSTNVDFKIKSPVMLIEEYIQYSLDECILSVNEEYITYYIEVCEEIKKNFIDNILNNEKMRMSYNILVEKLVNIIKKITIKKRYHKSIYNFVTSYFQDNSKDIKDVILMLKSIQELFLDYQYKPKDMDNIIFEYFKYILEDTDTIDAIFFDEKILIFVKNTYFTDILKNNELRKMYKEIIKCAFEWFNAKKGELVDPSYSIHYKMKILHNLQILTTGMEELFSSSV
jgi:hypothetical protein